MKIFICSDIHGDLDSMERVLEFADRENAEKILILGDLLYHGPRNDLPKTYAPKKVIELLNSNKKRILSVRGNCDTEVDQMVLDFPILADYIYLSVDGLNIFATHGHNYNMENADFLGEGDLLLHGHTHVLKIEKFGSNTYINPGSVALPKQNNPRSYAIYENRCFKIKDFDGKILKEIQF